MRRFNPGDKYFDLIPTKSIQEFIVLKKAISPTTLF